MKMNTQENKVEHLIESLLHQYHYTLGDEDDRALSSEEMIERIVKYYEDIIGCMPGNVYWLNKQCIVIGCNKNVLDMFGIKSLSEFKGLSFEDMVHIGKWTQSATLSFKKDTEEVIRTGKSKLNIEEPPIPHHDGRIIYFLTSRVPLFDQKKNVIGVVGISIDISELKHTQAALEKAKEQAEAASRAKSEFVANMSHDVKTPLSGIIGVSELLTERLQGDNLEFVQTLLMSGKQLLNFFDNCLEVFKLESGNITLKKETFSLKAMLDEINDLFQPAIRAKGLTLNIEYINHSIDYLIGSRVGIYRILLNLVGNAVKFTHQGHIHIIVHSENSAGNEIIIKISVKDTGIGIAKDKQNMIFERFTRLIPSYKGTYEGSGIGLYIVKKFVEAMLGSIEVDSEKNSGSTFTITLPFNISSEYPIKKEEKIAMPLLSRHGVTSKHKYNNILSTTSSSRKILIVEDNLVVQRMLSLLLSSMQCEVDVVENGENALEVFEANKYNLIFMDIGLPGMQGDAVTKIIRKIERDPTYHVPIIALTAHVTSDVNNHCLAAGIDNVYSKPLSRDQAKQILDHYCGYNE